MAVADSSDEDTSSAESSDLSLEKNGPWPTISNFLIGSFSAVSTPIFATKVPLESACRDLQVPHHSEGLRTQHFSFRTLPKYANFHILSLFDGFF